MLVHPLLKIQDLKISAIAEYDKECSYGKTTLWVEMQGHQYKAAMLPWDWMEGKDPNFLIVEACTGGYRVVPKEEMEAKIKATETYKKICRSGKPKYNKCHSAIENLEFLPDIHPEYNVPRINEIRLYASAVGHTKERKKVFNVPLEKLNQQYIDGYYVRPWGNDCVFLAHPDGPIYNEDCYKHSGSPYIIGVFEHPTLNNTYIYKNHITKMPSIDETHTLVHICRHVQDVRFKMIDDHRDNDTGKIVKDIVGPGANWRTAVIKT